MNISVGLCFYNDEGIFRTIESIPKTWKIIVIHSLFNNCGLKADKEQIERVKSYKNVEYHEKSGKEFECRNEYMKYADNEDILIVIDSDEYITDLKPEFYENIKNLETGMYGIRFRMNGKPREYSRLLANPSEIRYADSHKKMIYSGQIINVNRYKELIEGIEISSDDDLRSEQVFNHIQNYQMQMWKDGE